MAEDEPNPRLQLTSSVQERRRASDLDLRNARLAGEDLSGLSVDRLDLRKADLSGARLSQAQVRSCRLEAASFEAADCSGATFRLCTFDGARGASARFDEARIEDCSAKGADLTRANLRGARLTETSFSRAVLREATLDGSQGDGVEFRGADLGGATLRGARLDEADFRGADLTGADLSDGRFRSADFRGAVLDGARFDGADCEGSRFDEGWGPNGRGPAPDAGDENGPALDQAAFRFLAELVSALPPDIGVGGGNVRNLLARLQRASADLDLSGDLPPEAWKPWLEQLLKATDGEPSLDRTSAGLRSVAEQITPEDLQTWLDAVVAKRSEREDKPRDPTR